MSLTDAADMDCGKTNYPEVVLLGSAKTKTKVVSPAIPYIPSKPNLFQTDIFPKEEIIVSDYEYLCRNTENGMIWPKEHSIFQK